MASFSKGGHGVSCQDEARSLFMSGLVRGLRRTTQQRANMVKIANPLIAPPPTKGYEATQTPPQQKKLGLKKRDKSRYLDKLTL
eukprot:6475633-Amphidinium_carterae.1